VPSCAIGLICRFAIPAETSTRPVIPLKLCVRNGNQAFPDEFFNNTTVVLVIVFWFVPRGLQSPLRLRRWVRENETIPGDMTRFARAV
jgi:hypothetical protein